MPDLISRKSRKSMAPVLKRRQQQSATVAADLQLVDELTLAPRVTIRKGLDRKASRLRRYDEEKDQIKPLL